MENIPYRETGSSLLWLANGTHPDISYAIGQSDNHWDAAKRNKRYPKGTSTIDTTYDGNKEVITFGFTKEY